MKILHTADWHLGKSLEGNSRLYEQEQFIQELISICNNENIDLIIIAGDVFDSINPPALAEKLFYRSLRELSLSGARPIIVIAGNHDNYERLIAPGPLATELGIILIGTPVSIIPTGRYGTNCLVEESKEGCIVLKTCNERLVILTMPYLSESRLNKIIFSAGDESNLQKSYSSKVEELFKCGEQNYKDDSINIAIGHFYLAGGEVTNSERDIEMGGIYAVHCSALPAKAQYIAMGHLHRNQKIKGGNNAYYSGSPIQYSKSEANQKKYVNVVDINCNQQPVVDKIELTNYKPIEIWKTKSIEEAISKCRKNSERSCWVYLEILTDRPLAASEFKEMKALKKDIVGIIPLLPAKQETSFVQIEEKTPYDEFKEFYFKEFGVEPSGELVQAFKKIWDEEDEV